MAATVVMTVLSISILVALAFGFWRLNRKIEREADVLHVVVDGQAQQLSRMSSEVHFARAEVGRTREEVGRTREEVALTLKEVGSLRAEVETYVHGPPSLRRPPNTMTS